VSEEVIQLIINYAARIVGVLVLLVVAWTAAGRVASLCVRVLERRKIDATLSRFAGTAVRWAIILLASIASLGVFGVETTSFAAVIGAAGLAIGLAFQGSLSNLASGVMLLIFRPFSVDEVISVGGITGTVFAIDLFTTVLDTVDNKRVYVPNAVVFGGTIENLSYHKARRVSVSVGVDYGASIDEARNVLLRAAATTDNVHQDPEPAAVVTGLGASSVDFAVRVWVDSEHYWSVMDALTRNVKVALDEAGIGIPYQTIDINLTRDAA
jgi:small conductance mechanosensitive channel